MSSFSYQRIKQQLSGLSLTEIIILAALLIAAILLILYWSGLIGSAMEARKFKKEFEDQQRIAEAANKRADDAIKLANDWKEVADSKQDLANIQQGISQALREEIQNAVADLKQAEARTASSTQTYNNVRSGKARRPPPRNDDELRARLRSGATEFRNSNN